MLQWRARQSWFHFIFLREKNQSVELRLGLADLLFWHGMHVPRGSESIPSCPLDLDAPHWRLSIPFSLAYSIIAYEGYGIHHPILLLLLRRCLEPPRGALMGLSPCPSSLLRWEPKTLVSASFLAKDSCSVMWVD